jgi:hypothetical protein
MFDVITTTEKQNTEHLYDYEDKLIFIGCKLEKIYLNSRNIII